MLCWCFLRNTYIYVPKMRAGIYMTLRDSWLMDMQSVHPLLCECTHFHSHFLKTKARIHVGSRSASRMLRSRMTPTLITPTAWTKPAVLFIRGGGGGVSQYPSILRQAGRPNFRGLVLGWFESSCRDLPSTHLCTDLSWNHRSQTSQIQL